jgi:hypothetical protein
MTPRQWISVSLTNPCHPTRYKPLRRCTGEATPEPPTSTNNRCLAYMHDLKHNSLARSESNRKKCNIHSLQAEALLLLTFHICSYILACFILYTIQRCSQNVHVQGVLFLSVFAEDAYSTAIRLCSQQVKVVHKPGLPRRFFVTVEIEDVIREDYQALSRVQRLQRLWTDSLFGPLKECVCWRSCAIALHRLSS